jgi:hypothetical protein
MSFLAPLYALAALAVAAPILFHLIRRRPKERIEFSSLLFLDPAPPRLTRSSQVDQWLLLLLRAAAVGLVALAFARPYWDVPVAADSTRSGLKRLILVDVSASMRRTGYRDESAGIAKKWIQQSKPEDLIAIYTFDREIYPKLSFAESMDARPDQRQGLALNSLKELNPSWYDTQMGSAMVAAVDLLQMDVDSEAESALTNMELIVISDYQSGAKLDEIAQIDWPKGIQVHLERVRPAGISQNARAHLMSQDEAIEETDRDSGTEAKRNPLEQRARVTHFAKEGKEQFQLQWINASNKPIANTLLSVTVPHGQSLTVKIPTVPAEATALELSGDQESFDNRFFVAVRKPTPLTVVCIERPEIPPTESLAYFLKQVPFSSSYNEVGLQLCAPGQLEQIGISSSTVLIVASAATVIADLSKMKEYADRGGNVLWVLDQPMENSDKRIERAAEVVFGERLGEIKEASSSDYAMWQNLDFESVPFRDLSDPKFNDFSKVRFWRHRSLQLSNPHTWRVLANFDDQFPAIIQRSMGKGSWTIMMAGWQPVESQFALSSKFVPVLGSMVRSAFPKDGAERNYRVGDRITLKTGSFIRQGDLELRIDRDENTYLCNTPGIFLLVDPEMETPFSVNLVEAECNVGLLDLERFEQLGVPLHHKESETKSDKMQRQLRAVELESQQSNWRWILLGVLSLVGLESLVCVLRSGRVSS